MNAAGLRAFFLPARASLPCIPAGIPVRPTPAYRLCGNEKQGERADSRLPHRWVVVPAFSQSTCCLRHPLFANSVPGWCPGSLRNIEAFLKQLAFEFGWHLGLLNTKCYIGFRNGVSTASSFRGVSAKRRPGGILCFLFQSKGHAICKKGINAKCSLHRCSPNGR